MFRPRRDVRLMTLSHPLMARSMSSFKRKLWTPPSESKLNRFTLEAAELPDDVEKMAVISFTVLARNELSERFREGIAYMAIAKDAKGWHVVTDGDRWSRTEGRKVNDVDIYMKGVRSDWGVLRTIMERERPMLSSSLFNVLKDELAVEWDHSRTELSRLYKQRKDALRLDRTKYVEKLKRDYAKAEDNAKQMTFSEDINEERRRHYEEMRTRLNEANWETERANIESLIARLEKEEKRIMEKVLPLRYSLKEDGVLMQVAAVKVLVKEAP